jgi:hypothetical protein
MGLLFRIWSDPLLNPDIYDVSFSFFFYRYGHLFPHKSHDNHPFAILFVVFPPNTEKSSVEDQQSTTFLSEFKFPWWFISLCCHQQKFIGTHLHTVLQETEKY